MPRAKTDGAPTEQGARRPGPGPALLDRLIPPHAREVLRVLVRRRAPPPDPVAYPAPDTRPAPMRPLHPPAAINDNPLGAIHEAVERDLRNGGYLR